MSGAGDYPRDLTLARRRGRWVLSIHGPDVQGEVSSTTREYLDGIAEAYAAMRRDEEAGELGDQPAAGDPCEHYWAHACCGGLSVRLCLNCDEPDWADLRGQLAEARQAGALAERERIRHLAAGRRAVCPVHVPGDDGGHVGYEPFADLLDGLR